MKNKPTETEKSKATPATAEQLASLIRQRAHQIWQDCGFPHGCDLEHWLQAEREVKQVAG